MQTQTPPLYDPKAAARRLNVSECTVLRMARDPVDASKIGAIKLGRLWRFRAEAVERLVRGK